MHSARDATAPENRLFGASPLARAVFTETIMRKYIVPVLLALVAAAPGAAFAASTAPAAASSAAEQTAKGVVKFYNTEARSLELEDGTWFFLPLDYKAPDVKVGQSVTVHWKPNGSAHDVMSIDIG